MNERPPQPPEGKLISDAIRLRGVSIREASRQADISYGRWRQITSGYQNVSPGSYASVRAPAATLARMARAAGVTPEQLETEGDRPDAAQALREIRATPISPAPAAPARDSLYDSGEMPILAAPAAEIVDHLIDVGAEVGDAKGIYGPEPSGRQVFPGDEEEARIWERPELAGPEFEADRVRLIAFLRMMAARKHRGTNGSDLRAC
jgi:hypothetical protein